MNTAYAEDIADTSVASYSHHPVEDLEPQEEVFEKPSDLAQSIAAKVAPALRAGTGKDEIASIIHRETRDHRPIAAYASSLKQTLLRVIEAEDPHAELRIIAKSVGLTVI